MKTYHVRPAGSSEIYRIDYSGDSHVTTALEMLAQVLVANGETGYNFAPEVGEVYFSDLLTDLVNGEFEEDARILGIHYVGYIDWDLVPLGEDKIHVAFPREES